MVADRAPSGSDREGAAGDASTDASTVEDATGYGLTVTLLGGVLLALAYYGVLAVQGSRAIGQAMPEPFYALGLALLFVIELLNSRDRGVIAVGRALAFTAAYGALLVFAAEGGAYLWDRPEIALANYEGVTVLAVALVVAALAYVGYLAVAERGP